VWRPGISPPIFFDAFLSFVVNKIICKCGERLQEIVSVHQNAKGTKMKFDGLSNRVIGCAIQVHRDLGPGLLESAYEQCPAHELRLSGIAFRLQWPLPVQYRGVQIDCGYRVISANLMTEVFHSSFRRRPESRKAQ